jgi:tryptophan synthase alpha chain
VSIAGVTGAARPDYSRVAAAVARIKAHTSLPVAVGFGVKDAAAAQEIALNADGVVVGSALIDALAKTLDAQGRGGAEAVAAVSALVADLAAGVAAAAKERVSA